MGGAAKKIKKQFKRTGKQILEAHETALTGGDAGVDLAEGAGVATREALFGTEPDLGDDTPLDNITPAGAPVDEATLVEFSDDELEARKKKSKRRGTRSLQIPLGGVGGTSGIGTGS